MSAASANLDIKNIGQISIIVHDLPRATAFYRDALGLPLLFTASKLAFFDCGGVRLMLGPAETPELDHPSSILYFGVPRYGRKYHGVDERSPASFVRVYDGLPPATRPTRPMRITVSFQGHA